MPQPAARSVNTQRILQILQTAQTPLSAYEILAAARKHDINAPPTVYRALNKLITEGLAHRLESLNAYMACANASHRHTTAVFTICDGCGHVDEIHDSGAIPLLKAEAGRSGFTVDSTVSEVKGVCMTCAGLSA
jgi:Fur family transcriptional regulator, zinc uptake regulator